MGLDQKDATIQLISHPIQISSSNSLGPMLTVRVTPIKNDPRSLQAAAGPMPKFWTRVAETLIAVILRVGRKLGSKYDSRASR
jgi:hypothetical protein